MSHGLVTDAPITRGELLALCDERVDVVGATSAEGVAVVRLLQRLGFGDVVVHDMREREQLRRAFRTTHGAYSRIEQDQVWDELSRLLERGRFGADYLDGIGEARLVVLGQGWYLDQGNRERIAEAVGPDARITCMTSLYFALHRGPVAGITGTNGKSTTVAIADHLLTAGDVAHRTAGNERSTRQFLPAVDELPSGTWALLEISNRQLLQLSRSPQVAAITSLTPDHLEEHGGLDGYREAKARIFASQQPRDIAVANADDPAALDAARRSPAAAAGRLVRCGCGQHQAPSVSWRDGVLVAEDVPSARGGARTGQVVLATRGDVHLPGEHNLRNVAVAAATALACGVDPAAIAPALRAFEGKALRLQQLESVAGVEVWSDIKSTTPEATIAALTALAPRRRLLVAGGEDKGLDYRQLATTIRDADVPVFAVPGSATDKLEHALQVAGADGLLARFDALDAALDAALAEAASGDAVIVSPAAAGFWSSQLQGGTSLATLVRRRALVPQEVADR